MRTVEGRTFKSPAERCIPEPQFLVIFILEEKLKLYVSLKIIPPFRSCSESCFAKAMLCLFDKLPFSMNSQSWNNGTGKTPFDIGVQSSGKKRTAAPTTASLFTHVLSRKVM